jgi:PPOX class probable F420-dependent enzyme
MLSTPERLFVTTRRVAHLATADRHGAPHVLPVCFALVEDTLYITIDEKPKRTSARPLKRLRNITDNPTAAAIFDRYDEDWTRLAWVMLRGPAEILDGGPEHGQAQAALRTRYRQYNAMQLDRLPVIALRVARVTSWGALSMAS